MISTRNLELLPDPKQLKRAFQSMAMLDAIIMPASWLRYYWMENGASSDGCPSIGYMHNGSGDDLDAIFGKSGCLIRGFAHEYPMTPYATDPPRVFPGVLDEVPAEFADCKAAVHDDYWESVTFCIWRRHSDTRWHHGRILFPDYPDPDGSEFLLSAYDGQATTYHRWAEEYYYPSKFSLKAVRHVFEHRPLTDEIVRKLNPDRSLEELSAEMRWFGYPASPA